MSNLPSDHPKYWEYHYNFQELSDERLIVVFQYELTHPGFFEHRNYYIAALKDELSARGYSLSQNLEKARKWQQEN